MPKLWWEAQYTDTKDPLKKQQQNAPHNLRFWDVWAARKIYTDCVQHYAVKFLREDLIKKQVHVDVIQ